MSRIAISGKGATGARFGLECLLATLVVSALAAAALPAQRSGATAGYRIGPRDQIKVEVFELPQLTAERRVDEEGQVNLPVLGKVSAEGLTSSELASRIKDLLEKSFVSRATVSVEVVELLSRPISVIGAVAKPGTLGYPGEWSLLEALTAAGGLTQSRGDTIYVRRRAENGLSDQIEISVEALVNRADPTVNIPIFANDLINVEPARTITIYFLGEVAQRGALEFKDDETVTALAAIARAGGLTDRASPKILIKRRMPGGSLEEIEIHYKRILDGKDPDPTLEDGDILVVKESFF